MVATKAKRWEGDSVLRSVDFAVEELVFFFAGGGSAAEGAADEEDDPDYGQAGWNPGSHCVEPNQERV